MLGNPAPDGLDIGKFLLSSLELDSADLRCILLRWMRMSAVFFFGFVGEKFQKQNFENFHVKENKSHLSCPAPGLYCGSSGRHDCVCVCVPAPDTSKSSVGC